MADRPVRVRTSMGWQDIALVGPQGLQGPQGPAGPSGAGSTNVVINGEPPAPPTPEQQILFDHENRLRTQKGQPPLTLEDFAKKLVPK
jgi:hypothetical protein